MSSRSVLISCGRAVGEPAPKASSVVGRAMSRMGQRRHLTPQSGTRPVPRWLRAAPSVDGGGGGSGYGSLRYPPIGRWHTPHAGSTVSRRAGTIPRVLDDAHRFLPCSDAQRRPFGKFFLSSGEAVAALGTTRLHNRTAGPGAHPMPKPMLLGSTTVIGLKCSLHGRLLEFGATTSAPLPTEKPVDRTTTRSTLQAEVRFFRLWKTCYGHVPFTHPNSLSTPCGYRCGWVDTRF
jgi:hypothetical protein